MKIVSSLYGVFEEIREYHTKSSMVDGASRQKIVKTKDDFLDAIRYAYMMRRYAIRICDLKPEQHDHQRESSGRDSTVGY